VNVKTVILVLNVKLALIALGANVQNKAIEGFLFLRYTENYMDDYQIPTSISPQAKKLEEIQEQLNAQQQALVQIYKSTEKTRKIILWSGIFSLAMFLLPLIIVMVMLPKILGTFTGALGSVGGGSASPEALTEYIDLIKNVQE
jgi:hypothetical protein